MILLDIQNSARVNLFKQTQQNSRHCFEFSSPLMEFNQNALWTFLISIPVLIFKILLILLMLLNLILMLLKLILRMMKKRVIVMIMIVIIKVIVLGRK